MLFTCNMLRAQVIISGRVVDSIGDPVSNVSITYRDIGEVAVLGYAKSKSDGSFSFQSKATGDSIALVVMHLSYKKVQRLIANKTGTYTIALQAGNIELTEVEVDPFPIYKRKDTINYVVDAFTSKQDREIGDVIRKLPGIEVLNSRIYYQGKPIQKYMVNNLDLMEGRYGIINENLPADAVKNVQIVENDQPIKVLDSLVSSDRASLNLELKNPVTTTGMGKAGIGSSPMLWQLDFTPMVFGKSFQSLASIQTNNTGDDGALSIKPFYTGGNLFRPTRDNDRGPSYLSVRNVSSPGFDESKWLDNRLFLVSANMLQKLKDGLEVKGNLSYYNDRRVRRGVTVTDVFAPGRRILLTEAVDNRYRIQDLAGGIVVEKNEDKVYLRNRLSYHKRWERDHGSLALNTFDDIQQQRVHDDYSILNSLSLARFIGGQLVTIQSDIEFSETPQYLSVEPGQLVDALNGGKPYDRMQQLIGFKGFLTENNLSFVRRLGQWTFTPELTANYRSSRLETGITTTTDGLENDLGEGYLNDVKASRGEVGAGVRFNHDRGKWKFSGNLPYSLFLFNVEQQGENTLHWVSRGAFNPAASASYSLDSRQELQANVSYKRLFEEMNNTYRAFIATDYRSIRRYGTQLLGSQNFTSSLRYSVKNTLKGMFADAHYTYNSRLQDHLYRTSVDSLGQAVVDIADQEGRNNSHRLSLGYSQFFQAITTTAKIRVGGSIGQGDYLLNEVLATRRTHSWEVSGELNFSNWDFLNIMYRLDIGHARTLLALSASNTVIYDNHILQTTLHAGDRHSFSVHQAYYRNNIEGLKPQYFLDCSYSYHLNKWKTDIVLTGQNLLDNARYTQQFSNDYQLVETSFEMRPRQFVLSTRFRF